MGIPGIQRETAVVALLKLPQMCSAVAKTSVLVLQECVDSSQAEKWPRSASTRKFSSRGSSSSADAMHKSLHYTKQTDKILRTSIAELVLNPIASRQLYETGWML